MSAEGWSGDADIARWEALEAEHREGLESEAKAAEGEPEGPAAHWDADGPSWWQDPQAEGPVTSGGARPVAEPGAASDSPRDPRTDGVTPEILLADADSAIAASIEQAMTDRGWVVRRVDNGELALAEFLRLAPHCFVFDYSLPGMGGLDLLRKLSEFGVADTTRLVVNSVQTQAVHVQRARAMGADRFLDRPVRSPDQLVDAVAGQLEELGILGSVDEPQATPEPGDPSPVPEPESVSSGPQPAAGGLFTDGPTTPAPGADAESDLPAPPPAAAGEDRPYRSAFGSGGGPPGRIPRLD